jgi:hypothetical protein
MLRNLVLIFKDTKVTRITPAREAEKQRNREAERKRGREEERQRGSFPTVPILQLLFMGIQFVFEYWALSDVYRNKHKNKTLLSLTSSIV